MITLYEFDDQQSQSNALAKAVGDALQVSLTAQAASAAKGPGHVTLAVSGGSSPRPFLQTLSTQPFDWARIAVTLVDDRWVAETDSASNARFVREALLQHAASSAVFWPLVDTAQALDAHVAALNADPARLLPDIAVLGMGEDGHTASIFADSPEWDDAITTTAHFIAVHPGSAQHARVSLSLSALKRIDHLFLLIAGPRKRDVLKAATSTLQRNAISQLAHASEAQLNVYWSAN
ncbi:6-phosphogluconolactonase [Paraburkholderia xenovorans LB400]|uniref:6-phosphogluconolactonase n=1 Tax=Paraburkholderia xenovorans (strain LB400) TaxID=266265 RepID=Q13HK0_PARXL|nr:6-phosphogluconolactonase [Paraburkholderia xenovorans]ABE36439.1 6-phosphogluconolactonase [Paraburkholderia xenovorans LB400]AIP34406.1 6-phosphogluconolactonase [Paraburkholderia xenovorans LB400]